jgi:G protein beta subunit-like protein
MEPPEGILLAASYALRIHVFDIRGCKLIDEFEISNSQANRIVINHSDKKFYVGAYSYVFCYDLMSKLRKHSQAFSGHEGNVTDIVITPREVYSCGEDKKINIWDKNASTKPQISILTTSALNSIILMPSNVSVTVCDENGVVSLWDIRNPSTCLQKTQETKIPFRSLAISPNGDLFVAASQSGKTTCYKIEGNKFTENYTITSHNDTQLRCAISPNGKYFATSAADNSARIWGLDSGDMKQSLMSGESQEWTWDVSFTTDSQFICTGGSDCICRVWDVENGRMVQQMPQLEKCVSAIAYLDAF